MGMSYCMLNGVRLAAVYAAVPQKEIRLEDELEYYGGSLKKAERARKMLGTDRRRVAWPGTTASDLCKAAAQRLLEEQGVDRGTIDALIFVSQSPDYDLPATACVLQHELGLSANCAAFDVNQGCAGYVYGLWLAATLVSSGACGQVLLLVGDACCAPRDPVNRITTPLFGDGGSASLVCRENNAPPMHFSLGTKGAGYKAIIVPGGRSRLPYKRDFEENRIFFEDIYTPTGTPWRLNEVYMNGGEVFQFTLETVPAHLREFMGQAATGPEQVDWLFLHQANKQIVEMMAEKAGFPVEKAPWQSFSRYGNLSSASIPVAICDQFGGTGTSGGGNFLLCGYGVGLSWASCFLKTEGITCGSVLDFCHKDDAPGREERIRRWIAVLSEE